jgi:putative spermidine/putrescine transport system permease protein
MPRRVAPIDLSYSLVVWALATIAIFILVGPVLIILITSFTDNRSLKFPPTGFSLEWYAELFDAARSRQIHRAAGNSLEVALWATALATLFGTAASLAIARSGRQWARMLDTMFMSPMILPGVAFGLAALMYFTFLGFRPSLNLIILGHAIIIVPFVVRTTAASLSQLDLALLESSESLGASWFYTLRRVTLPIIAPGISAGAFLAFMASIDNVPVSLFLSGPRSDMLPIRLWGMIESTLDVRVAAISGLFVSTVILLMLVMERVVGLTKRMRD